MQKEILVQPFNEVFYKMCAYNPLLSAVNYLGGNVLPFLANDIFIYRYNFDNTFKIGRNFITIKNRFDLINEMGISIDNNICLDNFIEEVKEAINNEMLVYAPIDRFYWSHDINTEWYQKKHLVHYFLIFGYDDLKEKFKIIDVGPTCSKTEISYENLINCCEEGCNLLTKGNYKITRLYIKNESSIQKEYISFQKNLLLFIENMSSKKSDIFSGLDNIKSAAEYYAAVEPDRFINEELDNITQPFFHMDTSIQVELYRMHIFFEKELELIGYRKNIMNDFAIIRGILIKMKLTKEYSPKTFKNISDRLNQMYEYEYKYNETLFKLFSFIR